MFGFVLAVVIVWFLVFIIGNKKVFKWIVIFVVIGIVFIFLLFVRIGMVVFVLGGIVVYFSSRRSWIIGFYRKKFMKILILFGVVGLIFLLVNL